MSRRRCCSTLLLFVVVPFVHSWTIAESGQEQQQQQQQHRNEISPYIDLMLCPLRAEPWTCARQQSARVLDVWDEELHSQWQKLKVEADRQLNATIERRGYSATELLTKEKPSTILKKIEIGTNFMKEYFAETMDGFLGREYEHLQSKNAPEVEENESDEYDDDESNVASENNEEESEDNETTDEKGTDNEALKSTAATTQEDASSNAEFIDIEDANQAGQLKKPGGFGGSGKKKKKGQGGQPTTVLVVQPVQHEAAVSEAHGHGGGGSGGGGHGGKPLKQKRKKRKKQQHGGGGHDGLSTHDGGSDHLGLGLLEELVDAGDLLGGGGKRKKKFPTKYGRSNGVTRGKKKKKKKALMKLVLLGSFLKAKIELLLKILGAHLQIKFFAIALIGLLINIARFWIDIKRGGQPQKVVYVEHAHHQHHYEDHGEDWGGEQGGYWKRSLQTDPTIEEGGYTDSYQPKSNQQSSQQQPQSQQQPYDAHYMAYRNQWQ